MIGSSQNYRENIPENDFEYKKKTRVKVNPGLSANQPSNNWALFISSYINFVENHYTEVKLRGPLEKVRINSCPY